MGKKSEKIEIIISRILVFPFFAGIAFIGVMILFVKYLINFIRFGGEAISYTHATQRKQIKDIYDKLDENIESWKKQN